MSDGFTVEIKNKSLRSRLGKMLKAMGDIQPELEFIGNEIIERAKQSFDEETDPWGKPWKPLAPSTLARRLKTSGGSVRILRDTGMLFASLNTKVSAESVKVGAEMPYAAIHQFGGIAGRGARIPKRSYLPVTKAGVLEPKLRDRILKILTKGFAE